MSARKKTHKKSAERKPDTTAVVHQAKEEFNVSKKWDEIFALPTCVQILLMPEQQEELKIIVNKNVTQEYPWRHVFFGDFRNNYIIGSERQDTLLNAFEGYGDDTPLLLGYVPQVTQHLDIQPDGDPFIFFISSADTRKAMEIIKEIEEYEYVYYRRNFTRSSLQWQSLGSEKEVNRILDRITVRDDSIEAQSVFPVAFTGRRELAFRMTKDVRDGYVQLVPSETAKFDNILRKRLSVATQKFLPRKEMEQQTNQTYPINAFAQSQEITEIDDDTVDKSDSEEDREKGKPVDPNRVKPPLVLSRQVKALLNTLEFSVINFYRDDYADLTLRKLQSTDEPQFEEIICFANIEKTYNRYICSLSWYPNLSGLIAVSYAFGTAVTNELFTNQIDPIRRAVLDPNPVLLWSFTDNLNFKMEFRAPSEVTSLAFCPYDSSLLIGGCKNGQVCIWDLLNRIETMDYEEVLTAAQTQYRRMIGEFLKETIMVNEDSIVPLANISDLDASHNGPVTGIYFLDPSWYVNTYGRFYKEEKKFPHKAFLTCSFDGGLYFWDLVQMKPKKSLEGGTKNLPKSLSQSDSKYKKLIFRPLYRVVFKEPLCAMSIDIAIFKYFLQEENLQASHTEAIRNYPTKVVTKSPKEMRPSAVLATFYGHLERVSWTGMLSDDTKELVFTSQNFTRVHDGPINSTRKNPFCPEIFISIGRTIFAIWKDDYMYAPIISRKRPVDLTAVTWSTDRPAVFYLTRGDGNVEVWDILTRDDGPCMVTPIGGGTLTQIIEHGPKAPFKVIAMGDYNSSFRIVKVPELYFSPMPHELEKLRAFISKEELRKRFITKWEEKYYEQNKDIIEAKRQAEAEAQKEMDRLEKMQDIVKIEEEQPEKQADEKEEKTGAAAPASEEPPKKQMSYPQRMALQWEEINRKRVLHTLLARMQMDAERMKIETALEKERLAYEEEKKKTHEEMIKSIHTVLEQLRSCLLPEEIIDNTHLDLINSVTDKILDSAQSYDEIAEECREITNLFTDFGSCDLNEFLSRGAQRRRIINKSLGGNTQREYWYDNLKKSNNLDMGIWGYQYFTRHYEKLEGEEGVYESDNYDFFDFSTPEEGSEENEEGSEENEESLTLKNN